MSMLFMLRLKIISKNISKDKDIPVFN